MSEDREEHRLGTFVRVNISNDTMSRFCARAASEGIEPNEKGFYPVEAIVRTLIESYADGVYMILKDRPKHKEHSAPSGANYIGEKKS